MSTMIPSRSFFLTVFLMYICTLGASSHDDRCFALTVLDRVEQNIKKSSFSGHLLLVLENTRREIGDLYTVLQDEEFSKIRAIYDAMWHQINCIVQAYERFDISSAHKAALIIDRYTDTIRLYNVGNERVDKLVSVIIKVNMMMRDHLFGFASPAQNANLLIRARTWGYTMVHMVRSHPYISLGALVALSLAVIFLSIRLNKLSKPSSDCLPDSLITNTADYALLYSIVCQSFTDLSSLKAYLRFAPNSSYKETVKCEAVMALDHKDLDLPLRLLCQLAVQIHKNNLQKSTLQIVTQEENALLNALAIHAHQDGVTMTLHEKKKLVTTLNQVLPILIKVVRASTFTSNHSSSHEHSDPLLPGEPGHDMPISQGDDLNRRISNRNKQEISRQFRQDNERELDSDDTSASDKDHYSDETNEGERSTTKPKNQVIRSTQPAFRQFTFSQPTSISRKLKSFFGRFWRRKSKRTLFSTLRR